MKNGNNVTVNPNDIAKCYADFPSHCKVAEAYHSAKWFKQDEATRYTANQTLETLQNMFDDREICR